MEDQKSKSKKQSDTKDEEQPDDDFVFFVDRCFGRGLWRTLRAAGFNAEHKDDHFAQNTDDEVWMQDVARRGWVVLTRDTRIRLHPNERDAVIRSSLRLFSLQTKRGDKGRPGINGKEMAEIILANMDNIKALLRKQPGPFIASITRTGVKIMTTATQS